jgi:hypothetical protein
LPALKPASLAAFASRDTTDTSEMPDLPLTSPVLLNSSSETVQGTIRELPHWEIKEKLKQLRLEYEESFVRNYCNRQKLRTAIDEASYIHNLDLEDTSLADFAQELIEAIVSCNAPHAIDSGEATLEERSRDVREREEACALAFQKLAEEEMGLNERGDVLTARERALSEAQPDLSLSMAQIRRAVSSMSPLHLATLVKDIASDFNQRLQDGRYFVKDGDTASITGTLGTNTPSTSTLAASTPGSNSPTSSALGSQ